MRELTVYYCSKCGHYGFYQFSKNAVCPVCHNIMNSLPMSYQSFMNMEYGMRDQLIANQIAGDISPSSSVVQRITELEKAYECRFTAIKLKSRIDELEASNHELQDSENLLKEENNTLRCIITERENTIAWMHDTIWELLNQSRQKAHD